MLIIDDVLALPGTIGGVILNTIIQTAYKSSWMDYQRRLNNALIVAKHAKTSGKLSREEYAELETHIFKEMRLTRRVLTGATG